MLPNRLSHSLNDEVSTIIYKSKETATRRWIIFQLVAYLIYVVRFSFIFYSILSPNDQYHPSRIDFFDHLLRYFSTDRDYLFSLTYISLFLYASAMINCLYLTPNGTLTWLIYHDLVLQLGVVYRESGKSPEAMRRIHRRHSLLVAPKLSRFRYILPTFLLQKLKLTMVKWNIWWAFDHIKKRPLRRLEMHYFPKVPVIVKIRLLQMTAVCDLINSTILRTIYPAYIVFLSYLLYRFSLYFSIWVFPLILLDCILFLYLLGRLLAMSLFFSGIACLYAVFYGTHFPLLNQSLIFYQSTPSQPKMKRSTLPALVKGYLEQHTRISMIAITIDEQVWSTILLVALLSQLPANVYTFFCLLSMSLTDPSMVHHGIILASQFGILGACLYLVARFSKVLHSSTRLIHSTQQRLPSSALSTKLKWLNFYERLTSRTIGVSIGASEEAVTYKQIFQILLLYFAYVLFLFKTFI